MAKRVQIVFRIAILVTFVALVWSASLQGQQTQSPSGSQAQPSQPQQPPDQGRGSQGASQSQASDPAAGASTEFIGTIAKQGNKYVFQDAASGQTYDIDHQDQVQKFDGKKVRVHGTLDPQTKTIHVQ